MRRTACWIWAFSQMSSALSKYLPEERQTLLFSATIPQEIASLANRLLKNPARISITPSAKPVEKIEQKVYLVEKAGKAGTFDRSHPSKQRASNAGLTRTSTVRTVWARDLNRAGIKSKAIHGDKSQNQRQTRWRISRPARLRCWSRPILRRVASISPSCRL